MSKVRFVAFKGQSLVSRVIRFVTRSKDYSHIAYLSLNNQLIECWPTKNNKYQHWAYSKFENHKKNTSYEIWEFNVGKFQARYIDDEMHKLALCRVKYDWLGCLGFVFKLVKDSKTRMFCSEGCISPIVKVFNWNKITPSHVSPQDFIELIQAFSTSDTEASPIHGRV